MLELAVVVVVVVVGVVVDSVEDVGPSDSPPVKYTGVELAPDESVVIVLLAEQLRSPAARHESHESTEVVQLVTGQQVQQQ